VPPAAALAAPVVCAQCPTNALDVTKPLDGGAAGVVKVKSARLVIARAHVEVKPQLVVDVRFNVGTPEAEVAPPHGRLSG